MATYYVDSNATGLNDGSSWTDAWTSITSALPLADNDVLLVANNHYETFATQLDIVCGTNNFSYIISTNPSTGAYQAGAELRSSVNGSGYTIQYNVKVHGLKIVASGYASHQLKSNGSQEYYECTIEGNPSHSVSFAGGLSIGSDGFNSGSRCRFVKCTIDFTEAYLNGDNYRRIVAGCHTELVDCVLINTATAVFSVQGSYNTSSFALVKNCDISSSQYLSRGSEATSSKVYAVGCKVHPSFTATESAITYKDYVVECIDCDDGSISAQAGITLKSNYYGEQNTDTGTYRTNGANDGTSDFSWKLVSNANAIETYAPFESSIISRYVESGSQTITVYVAGSASLNDDDFWIEVESPSEEVSPTAQGKFRTTKPDPLATPTALTTDTSGWTGAGVGTRQKVEVPISPTIAGTVTVRCYLAKPSTIVYVDPKISLTGNQRVFNGVLVDTDESVFSVSGGGSSSPTYTPASGTQIYPFRTFAEDDFDKGGTKFHPLS